MAVAKHLAAPDDADATTLFAYLRTRVRFAMNVVTKERHRRDDNPVAVTARACSHRRSVRARCRWLDGRDVFLFGRLHGFVERLLPGGALGERLRGAPTILRPPLGDQLRFDRLHVSATFLRERWRW